MAAVNHRPSYALPGAHIVATALRCPVGLDAASAAVAIRAGINMVAEHPALQDMVGEMVLCGRDPLLDPGIDTPDRMVQMAEHCLLSLAQDLMMTGAWTARPRLLLALPEVRPGFEPADARRVAQAIAVRLSAVSIQVDVELFGVGHAGGLQALGEARSRVIRGDHGLVLVGGVDSYLGAQTLRWLDEDRRLARVGVRAGLPPGEGAAFVAVANEATCQRHGLASLTRVCGVACAQEHRDPAAVQGLMGEALTIALREVAEDFCASGDLVGDAYGDINGERVRTEDWGFALMRTAHLFRDGTEYAFPAGQCGDMGAATGPMACVLAAQAWRFGRASNSRALAWAGSWGGLRAAALLESVRA